MIRPAVKAAEVKFKRLHGNKKGTFDVSLLSIDDGVFEVLATSGDAHLGGEDIDSRMCNYFASEFKRKYKKDFSGNPRSLRRMRTACERAKRNLSSSSTAQIEIDSLFEGTDFYSSITRAKLEDICGDIFRDTLKPIEQVLKDAKVSKNRVDEVVLVGGSTRIPKIQELVSNFFNGKELCRSVNPDEAVAYGAAVQAYILTGGKTVQGQELLLMDVAPLSLGIETVGGMMTPIIPRNSTIPTKKSEIFTTDEANQEEVLIEVYEGERPKTKYNNKLGKFELRGIPPAPRGVPQIEVTFDLDANGLLHVTAKDQGRGGSRANITINNERGRLSQEEIERMVREAEQFAEEDALERDRAESKNELEAYLYSVKNQLEDGKMNEVMTEDEREELLDKIAEVEEWLDHAENAEKEEFESIQKDLERVYNPIVSRMYEGTSSRSNGPTVEEVD